MDPTRPASRNESEWPARNHDPVVHRLPFGITVTRDPVVSRPSRLPVLLALIGLALVAVHDVAYRQTGGTDFELGLISHAGVDMLAVVLALSVAAFLHDAWNNR